jgi:8-oxo-dGTP pyrophosphatase MutT (NUDIX family)
MTSPLPQPWKIQSSTYPLETKWLRVRQDTCVLPDGSVIDDYFVIERADVVGIVALTDDNQVVMNRQYKHGIGEIVHEIPAGMVDPGESPEVAARRELEEESGYTAREWTHLSTLIASPTGETNRYHIFLARGAFANGKKMEHPREEIVNDLVPLADIESRIQTGDIRVMWTIVALDRARAFLNIQQL